MRFAIAIVSLLLIASSAYAQERVTTLEYGPWASTIAELQSATDAQGRVIHVCVDVGDGTCAPCGAYSLALDDAGWRAFRIDSCDPSTGATRMVLTDRSALFDHDDVIPRPRVLTIHAALVRDIASSGGARTRSGSAVSCTARIQPFLRDLEHGTNIALPPDRYEVHVEHASVSATPIDDGWVLSASERIATDVDYVVVDRVTGREELRGHTALACSSETSTETVPAPPATTASPDTHASDSVAPAPADRSAHFTIRGGTIIDMGFGQVSVGGIGGVGLRGWYDDAHWIGWSAELLVGGEHIGCSTAIASGHCGSGGAMAMPLDASILAFSAPFTTLVSLAPGGGLHLRLTVAPAIAYAFGSFGGALAESVMTATFSGGFEYDLGWLSVAVTAGYRVPALALDGVDARDQTLANGYGNAMTTQMTISIVI